MDEAGRSQLRLVVGSSRMGHPEVQTGSRITALEKLERTGARDSVLAGLITMRRRIFIFAFLLGLLGSVHSAFACATNALVEDCCRSGMEMPCDHAGGGNATASDAELCCATTPGSAIATVSFKKSETESLQRSWGSVVAVAYAPMSPAAPTRVCLHSRSSPDLDAGHGAGTYLRTLRLRL